jgi:hypothetical protein
MQQLQLFLLPYIHTRLTTTFSCNTPRVTASRTALISNTRLPFCSDELIHNGTPEDDLIGTEGSGPYCSIGLRWTGRVE